MKMQGQKKSQFPEVLMVCQIETFFYVWHSPSNINQLGFASDSKDWMEFSSEKWFENTIRAKLNNNLLAFHSFLYFCLPLDFYLFFPWKKRRLFIQWPF